MMPLVGFLPPTDPRVRGTVDGDRSASCCADGFVRRYDDREDGVDGLPPGEGRVPRLPLLAGRQPGAASAGSTRPTALFERLLGLANDVGLLSEEYDPAAGRLLGNFPQAFTHVALVNTAHNLSSATRPALHRSSGADGIGDGGLEVRPSATDR